MKIARLDFHKDPNIGLFSVVTDEFCIVNNFVNESKIKIIKKVLKTPVFQASMLGTGLLGIFMAGNSRGLLVSSRVHDKEIETLKKKLDVLVLDTKHTAMGNMILCNNNGCIISKDLEKYRKDIKYFLGVETRVGTIGGMNLVGSLGVCNSRGCLVHKDINKKEKNLLEKVLDVPVSAGTVNFGNPWVKSGILANSFGCLVGSQTSGPELGIISEALGFL
ncbi:MAG: translation initiation factor IF-6 [Candidatus Aenigmarchaeota archaeon]|nr:translation initiation factor IF-6 [Candidatus Aenigmarchaeota archaeon]